MLESGCAQFCEHHRKGKVASMVLIRVGEKVIDREKIERVLDKLFELRQNGASQAEAAAAVGIDRSFVSRIENLGEVRKGKRVALIGFPIGNKADVDAVAHRAGVDYTWLMNNEERWAYVEDRSGIELLNDVVREISSFQQYDQVIFLGSDFRVRLIEAILGDRVTSVVIGRSPIHEDVHVDPEEIAAVIEAVRGGADKQ